MKRALCAAGVLALLVLGWRAAAIGLAGDDLDPVGRISAQDEALYAHSAIAMARGGDWLTPAFMGRHGLYKPPLLMWAAALSARVFGVSTFALRLPVVAASAAAVCLVFLWVLGRRGWAAAVGAAALVLSNRLWVVMGAMCLTDGLLAAAIVAAVYTLYRSPRLESGKAFLLFSASIASGILAKSVAGMLPAAMLALYWLLAPARCRPALGRAALAVALGCAAASPWFLYQMRVHPRWFWAEHVGLELVAFGTQTPPQTSRENQAVFYLVRQWLVDPALVLLALSALPAWVAALRRHSPSAILLLAWAAVVGGAALAWRYRNLSYLLPLVPALAIAAAGYGPLFRARRARWGLALLALVFAVKAAFPSQTWGLPFQPGTRLEVAPLLRRYCEMGRANELIQVGMDDALYGAALLPRVRYLFIGSDAPPPGYTLDFPGMGIVLTADQFAHLDAARREALPRLREWGLDSAEPVGTVILARSRDDLLRVIQAHPENDFLLPRADWECVAPAVAATHSAGPAEKSRVLLLSLQSRPRAAGPAACGL